MKAYNICWSGGVDSTFIVTQLSQYPVTIRPFYVKGQTFRLSEPQELAAISSIRELLLNDPRTKAEIMQPEIIEPDDPRVKDREIVKTHRRIYLHLLQEYKDNHGGILPPAGSQQIYADGAFVSPQYIACSSLARHYRAPIVIGFTCDDLENVPVLNKFSVKIERDAITGIDFASVSEETLDKDIYMLFKDFVFPIAGQKLHKLDLWHWFADNNYTQVRSKTIFCQAPIVHDDGTWEPCGRCATCIGAIRERIVDAFTDAGLSRFRDYEENHEKEPERFRMKAFERTRNTVPPPDLHQKCDNL